MLVVPLLIASTLLVLLLVGSAVDRAGKARVALASVATRLESSRASVTPRFAGVRQQLLLAEARTEEVERTLTRFDAGLAAGASGLVEARLAIADSPGPRQARSRRTPTG